MSCSINKYIIQNLIKIKFYRINFLLFCINCQSKEMNVSVQKFEKEYIRTHSKGCSYKAQKRRINLHTAGYMKTVPSIKLLF